MWINEFKVAIVTKNTKEVDRLISEMPQFKTLQEMQEAFYLFNHARELLENLKIETSKSMKKIKETISYIESTSAVGSSKLDIIQ